MKKYSIVPVIAGILVLIAGCRLQHDTNKSNTEQGSTPSPAGKHTVLTIKNQSSFSIKDIKYNDQTVSLLQTGSSCKVQLAEKANGYLYFTLYDKTKNVSFSVRTNDTIIVEKGKTQIFDITDNTLIIQTGQTQPIKLLNLMNPAVLKVYNETSWDILEINYGGKTHKSTLAVGKEWETSFGDNMQHELKLKLLKKKDNTTVSLTLKDIVIIELGKIKEVHIKNATLAVQEGKTEPEEIRQLLGVCTLTVINKSSADSLSVISCAGKISEQLLLKDNKIEFEYDSAVDEFINFQINNEENIFNVKTVNKIIIHENEKSTVTINDETLILYSEYANPIKIKDLLETAFVTIDNKTRSDIIGISYADVRFGDVQKNGQIQKVFLHFDKTPEHIIFSVVQRATGKTITAKTSMKFSINKKEIKTFTLNDDTEVIKDGTTETVSIKNLLGFGSFKLENRTSASSIKNVNYADYTTSALAESEIWELDKAVDDFIFFEVKTSRTNFKVKTQEKIKTDLGEEKKFTLTDETPVIPLNETEAVSIKTLVDAAVIQIFNKTSVNALTYVIYGGVNFDAIQNNKEMNLIDFKKVPAYIYFTIYNAASGKNVNLRTLEKFSASKKEFKRFYIKNETQVVIEETGSTTSIRKILGITCLKFINQSTAKSISEIKFAGALHSGAVPQGYNCDFECNSAVEDYIYFDLENEFGTWSVKTTDKVNLAAGEEKEITLTDDTRIIIEYTPATTMRSFINAAKWEVKNESSTELLNVTYDDSDHFNMGSLPRSTANWAISWDYTTGKYPASFEIKAQSGNILKVKTAETKALQNKQTISFVITDTTPVIIEATDETTSIRDILNR